MSRFAAHNGTSQMTENARSRTLLIAGLSVRFLHDASLSIKGLRIKTAQSVTRARVIDRESHSSGADRGRLDAKMAANAQSSLAESALSRLRLRGFAQRSL
jgi:hypothetical protein